MKTLIIGSGGQLGKALSSILEDSIPLSHDDIDLRNVDNIIISEKDKKLKHLNELALDF